ncbi:hypothetical protein [Salmonirosea aquatica]|uniref:hypothetical protein n=1 Tax=Salmonirosea aquatica TaxID=2654236 RepID=UPI0035713662
MTELKNQLNPEKKFIAKGFPNISSDQSRTASVRNGLLLNSVSGKNEPGQPSWQKVEE